jgi:outer membrane protein insertion porin family
VRKRFVAVLSCALLCAAFSALAQGFRSFVVKEIRVEGIQRTELGTVFSYLPVKVGETFTEDKAREALRALYATGFFKDVRIEAEGGVLIVYVEERPAIAQIDFAGVKEFQSDVVRKVLREQGLSEGRIFDRAVLESAERELKRQYLSRGRYSTDIQTTVTPLERNRVGINITVSEGEVTKIRSMNIVGAHAFSEQELRELITLRTPGWLTWYTKQDQYSRQRLAGDLETLRSHYLDNGYLDFNIDSTQVSITPDKRDIYISIDISEGEKYTVTEVLLAGQLTLPASELQPLVKLKAGDVFSRAKLTETTKAIADRLGNDGYAFANVNAVPQVDKAARKVSFTLMVDPGRRVYVRRIDISGNNKTRDEVVRREMRQLEGAYYDTSKIQLSRRRVDRTQYFSEVSVDTQPVEGSADQVDVSFSVKERPTGSLMVGAGFSSVDKLVLSASVSQTNIFGSGKYLSAAINSGQVNKVYSLSYMDPYYTVDGVSRGFDIYRRDTNASTLAIGPYRTKTLGGGVKFGYPLSETQSLSFGLNGETVALRTFSNSPTSYLKFVESFGSYYSYGAATIGWASDSRDSLITPTSGTLKRASTELADGDLKYYRVGYVHQWLTPLSRKLTFGLNAELGYADGRAGQPLPFFKSYYAGGPGSVRGYGPYSLGPRGPLGEALGGKTKIITSAELLFPMPGAEQDRSLRLVAFVDAGQVYADNRDVRLGQMRSAAGLALNWSSPIGPLNLSYGRPLNDRPGDNIQRLQFTFGTMF